MAGRFWVPPRCRLDSAVAVCFAGPPELESSDTSSGFGVLPEMKTLDVPDEMVAPFSLPQEALRYVPDEATIVAKFKNGDGERMIHCNTELPDHELEHLRALYRLGAKSGKAFPHSLAAQATRYLSKARGDPKKALKCMDTTQEWRQNYFRDGPISAASVVDDLAHGIVYFAGRDHCLRPALVLRPGRVPRSWFQDKRSLTDRVLRMLVFSMEYMLRYMVLPGVAESAVLLIDFQGVALSHLTSSAVSTLTAVGNVMSNHYLNRVARFYIVNVPSTLSSLAWLGLRFLTERQQQKLRVLRDPKELRHAFALHQLEADLGGERPVLESFFPFPLPAGPFEAGYEGGPVEGAVPGLHEAFKPMAMRGRLWDPTLSAPENCALELTEVAPSLLERCCLQASGGERCVCPVGSINESSPSGVYCTKSIGDQLAESSIGDPFDIGTEDTRSGKSAVTQTLSTRSDSLTGFLEMETPAIEDASIQAEAGGCWLRLCQPMLPLCHPDGAP